MQKLLNSFLLTAVAMFATACIPTAYMQAPTHRLEPVVLAPAPYKRLVEVYSPDSTLTTAVKQAIADTENIEFTEETGAGEFTLSFTKKVLTAKHKPRLVGMLNHATVQDEYKISYTLTNNSGEVLTEGQVLGKGAKRQVILPNVSVPSKLDKSTANLVATEAVMQIVPYINARPWRARITSVIDSLHVSIVAGRNVGLKINDILTTETHPVAKLEVALFEKLPHQKPRTILRLVEGDLPQTGRMLIAN